MSEQVPSKEWLDHAIRQAAIYREVRFQSPAQMQLCAAVDEIARLQSIIRGKTFVTDSAPEPPAVPHSANHLKRFTEWLVKEMPAGTVIGDPAWWARKLLAAACVFADEMPDCEGCAEFVRMQHDIASRLGVDADTDSIDLHGRIYGALSSAPPPGPAHLKVGDRVRVKRWNSYGIIKTIGYELEPPYMADAFERERDVEPAPTKGNSHE